MIKISSLIDEKFVFKSEPEFLLLSLKKLALSMNVCLFCNILCSIIPFFLESV